MKYFLVVVSGTSPSGWSVSIVDQRAVIALTGKHAGVVVLESADHDELEHVGGRLLRHVLKTAVENPMLFGRDLVITAADSFMRLPKSQQRCSGPGCVTPATVH